MNVSVWWVTFTTGQYRTSFCEELVAQRECTILFCLSYELRQKVSPSYKMQAALESGTKTPTIWNTNKLVWSEMERYKKEIKVRWYSDTVVVKVNSQHRRDARGKQ